jgi:hypothetical protein
VREGDNLPQYMVLSLSLVDCNAYHLGNDNERLYFLGEVEESVCVYVFGHLRHHVKVVIIQKEVERTRIPALATVTDLAEEHVQFSRQLDRVARSGVWC